MVGVTAEDEFKMLYHAIVLSGFKPNFDDLAIRMGLKRDATGWRYNKLMKRLQAEFGGPATAANASNTPTKTTKTGGSAKKKTTGARKRKAAEEDSDDSSEEGEQMKKKIKKSTAAEAEQDGDGEDVGASEEIGGVDIEG